MKKVNPLTVITLFLLSLFFTSCEAIGGIFKAGMGFGIFIAIVAAVLIVIIVFKFAKNK